MVGIIGILLGATSLQKYLVGLRDQRYRSELPNGAIRQITKYVSRHSTFNNFQELKQYFQ
ncbi:MAG TPA: hypothetical protein DGB85_11870 [Deltaproteobacteria bacterium]|nr:hypothetical protein [Deltaproteobacteria bacterium]